MVTGGAVPNSAGVGGTAAGGLAGVPYTAGGAGAPFGGAAPEKACTAGGGDCWAGVP